MKHTILLVLGLHACRLKLAVDPAARISCGSDGLCPEGTTCRQNVGRCVGDDADDQTPPELLQVTIDPEVGGADTAYAVTLVFNEPLGGAPALRLDEVPVPLTTSLDQRFDFLWDGTLTEGEHELEVTAFDLLGNQATLPAGAVQVDETPPGATPLAWLNPPVEASPDDELFFATVLDSDALVSAATLLDQDGAPIPGAVGLALVPDDAGAIPVLRLTGRVALEDFVLDGADAVQVELTIEDVRGNRLAAGASRTPLLPLDITPPDTSLGQKPDLASTRLRAAFTFSSPDPDVVGFWCSIDGGPAFACDSPLERVLDDPGPHDFAVAAIDDVGLVDATPATYAWSETRTWRGDALAVGPFNTCAIASDDTLWCWGSQLVGAVGNNVSFGGGLPTPQRVGREADWRSVVAGAGSFVFTPATSFCGIRDDGGAHTSWCWGVNFSLLFGDGASLLQVEPRATGESSWQSLALSGNGACGIRVGGELHCWGDNYTGQLGDDTTVDRLSPVQVGSASDWLQVAVTSDHTCGIRAPGDLYCWGANVYSQLGDPTADPEEHTPNPVVGDDWLQISVAGAFTCGIRDASGNRALYCFGDWGGEMVEPSPVEVDPGPWLTLHGSSGTICGVRAAGGVACWGDMGGGLPGFGSQLDGTVSGFSFSPFPSQEIHTPLDVPGTEDLIDFWPSARHGCGLTSAGEVLCWGDNEYGELGDGSVATGPVGPITVSGAGSSGLVASNTAACTRDATGVWCWGDISRLLGAPTNQRSWRRAPEQVDGGSDWVDLEPDAACGLREATPGVRALWCWTSGTPTPAVVGGDTDWQKVVGAHLDTTLRHCGIRSATNNLWCWGSNSSGALGLGATSSFAAPAQVGVATVYQDGWTDVALGAGYGCGITGGRLYCWGPNTNGRLGDGAVPSTNIPVRIGLGVDWTRVGVATTHSCGLRGTGELWCWGNNASGQLGLGDTDQRPAPTRVGSDADWTDLALGADHTCGVRGGVLYCWGANINNVLLDATRRSALVEPLAYDQFAAVTDVAAGSSFTCARHAGGVSCFGTNSAGQLGGGTPWGPSLVVSP